MLDTGILYGDANFEADYRSVMIDCDWLDAFTPFVVRTQASDLIAEDVCFCAITPTIGSCLSRPTNSLPSVWPTTGNVIFEADALACNIFCLAAYGLCDRLHAHIGLSSTYLRGSLLSSRYFHATDAALN